LRASWQWRYSAFATDWLKLPSNWRQVTMWLFLTKARLKKGRMVTLLATAMPARCASELKPNALAWRYAALPTD